jgi:hypothetical protein
MWSDAGFRLIIQYTGNWIVTTNNYAIFKWTLSCDNLLHGWLWWVEHVAFRPSASTEALCISLFYRLMGTQWTQQSLCCCVPMRWSMICALHHLALHTSATVLPMRWSMICALHHLALHTSATILWFQDSYIYESCYSTLKIKQRASRYSLLREIFSGIEIFVCVCVCVCDE